MEKQIGGFKGKTVEEKFNNKLKELNNIIDSRTTEKLDEFIVQNYPQNKELIENYKLIRDEMKKREIQKWTNIWIIKEKIKMFWISLNDN